VPSEKWADNKKSPVFTGLSIDYFLNLIFSNLFKQLAMYKYIVSVYVQI